MQHEVVILAAGQGTRMRSTLPKVLHPIAGKTMLNHVLETVDKLAAKAVHVVVGHGAEKVRETIKQPVNWALQAEQLGTGHAVAQAMPQLDEESIAVIVYGDVPLIKPQTLARLIAEAGDNSLALLTVSLPNPTGYGRIIRNDKNQVIAIVEQKDASEEQLAINETNTGMMAVKASHLVKWLPALSSENAQGEYYLTDIISMAVSDHINIKTQQPEHEWEVKGVNDREQIAQLERYYQHQQAKYIMAQGAGLADPNRIDIRGNLTVGKDVSIDINCVFIGDVALADGVVIDANCILENSCIGANTHIKANSLIEQATIAENCEIGPFARLRPGTQLAKKVKIGNFVETKKVNIGDGSKINHLSYIGDCTIGLAANIGAGTIICNYDGVNKHHTTIGDEAFIGSNSALVAPVKIGNRATVAAGSTVTSDVADENLAVARSKQRQIKNWQRPEKNKSIN